MRSIVDRFCHLVNLLIYHNQHLKHIVLSYVFVKQIFTEILINHAIMYTLVVFLDRSYIERYPWMGFSCFCVSVYFYHDYFKLYFLCWSSAVLSYWEAFVCCMKQLNSDDTATSLLAVRGAISTKSCEMCIPCSQMPCPSEYVLLPVPPTDQQVAAALGHPVLLWETMLSIIWLHDWSKTRYEID